MSLILYLLKSKFRYLEDSMELHPFPTDKQAVLPLTLPILGFGVFFFSFTFYYGIF